jgi:hypothetical protein
VRGAFNEANTWPHRIDPACYFRLLTGIRTDRSGYCFEQPSSLRPDAKAQLEQLEAALQKDSLAIYRFQIAGHTDASGSAEYNRRLSRDRAETVRRFLVTRGIDPDRLEVVGNGEDELLLPDWPLHEDNRRVEIRNLGELGWTRSRISLAGYQSSELSWSRMSALLTQPHLSSRKRFVQNSVVPRGHD